MKFTVYGNHLDPKGNPIGYYRTTQGAKWKPEAIRYNLWKSHVVAAYIDAGGTVNATGYKPLKTGKEKWLLTTMSYFANDVRPDPDNVQKGVADAIFVNDKYVIGTYDFAFDHECPRVEIEIHRVVPSVTI
ncbi:RusA family crossover junction endodeoxyribonuclease [Tsuneonella sp. HG222]